MEHAFAGDVRVRFVYWINLLGRGLFRISVRAISKPLKVLTVLPMRQTSDNNVMHAKPDLRVFLKWMTAGSGSVITDVIPQAAGVTCSTVGDVEFR